MAYDSRVYRILIASPSDVEEEREIAVRVIQEWNDLYSYTRKVVLLPLRWETHTAPEYGVRPQEVINRAIVDQCDLLVGVFWTRIGSPTGVADSGTLEEIERVGNAGKPVMLYFSRVEIDPERIDLAQIEKLKEFKKNSYPKGLIEGYKSIIEFRDKFAKQIELRVRDLQKDESSGSTPLSLQFLSIDEEKLLGRDCKFQIEIPNVTGLDAVPKKVRGKVEKAIKVKIEKLSYHPLVLAIDNSSSSGVRNVYVELEVQSNPKAVEVTDSPASDQWVLSALPGSGKSSLWTKYFAAFGESETKSAVEAKLAKFDPDKLQGGDGKWALSFEWEALQPQRTRIIKPVLYVSTQKTANIQVSAKVFADTFPEPLLLEAHCAIDVRSPDVELDEFLPEWKSIVSPKDDSSETE